MFLIVSGSDLSVELRQSFGFHLVVAQDCYEFVEFVWKLKEADRSPIILIQDEL